MKKIAEPLDDLTFKFLWKNNISKRWLKDILGKIINIDLTDFDLYYNEDSEGPKLHKYELDILLKKDNILVIVELNKFVKDTILIKNRSYQYRKAGNQFLNGEKYYDYTVILINLNNIDNSVGIEKYELHDNRNNKFITHLIENDIYLKYYKERWYNYLERSLSIFNYKNDYKMMKKIAKDDKELQDVINVLEVLNMDDIYVEIMEHMKAEEKLRRTENSEYYNEGINKGINQGIMKIAKNMLKEDYDIDKISSITGLSKQEIMKLN